LFNLISRLLASFPDLHLVFVTCGTEKPVEPVPWYAHTGTTEILAMELYTVKPAAIPYMVRGLNSGLGLANYASISLSIIAERSEATNLDDGSPILS